MKLKISNRTLEIAHRLIAILIILIAVGALLAQWNIAIGFNPIDMRWWAWLFDFILKSGSWPDELLHPLWWTGAAVIVSQVALAIWAHRAARRKEL